MEIRNIVLTLVVVLSLGNMASAQVIEETANNWTVTWNTTLDKTNKKEYIVEIQNMEVMSPPDKSRDFNLSLVLDQISVPGLDFDMEFYQWSGLEETFNNFSCSQMVTVEENGTNSTYCNQTVNNPYTKIVAQWEESKNPAKTFDNGQSNNYGVMNIPSYGSGPETDDSGTVIEENGTKKFKVIIKNFDPVFYDGRLGIFEESSSNLFHPLINSTSYESDFSTDADKDYCYVDSGNLELSNNFYSSLETYHTLNPEDLTASQSLDSVGPYDLSREGTLNERSGLLEGGLKFNSNIPSYLDFGSNPLLNIGSSDWSAGYHFRVPEDPNPVGIQYLTFLGSEVSGSDDDEYLRLAIQADSGSWDIRYINKYDDSCIGGDREDYTYDANMTSGTNHSLVFNRQSGVIEIWLDGQEVLAKSDSTNTLDGCQARDDGQVGTLTIEGGGTQGEFNGTIWDFFIAKASLSDSQIQEYYNNGVLRPMRWGVCTYNSTDFNTGRNQDAITPFFSCSGNCEVNVTGEGELFSNVTSGNQFELSSKPSDNNLTFSYDIRLLSGTTSSLNMTFKELNTPPTLNIPDASGQINDTIGTFYTQANGSDADNDTLTYSIVSDPTGNLQIGSSSGNVTLASEFDSLDIGEHPVNVSVSDGEDTVYETFNLTITDLEEGASGTNFPENSSYEGSWTEVGDLTRDLRITNNAASGSNILWTDDLNLVFGNVTLGEVVIRSDSIFVDTAVRPDLDANATLTFIRHSFAAEPEVYKDGVKCTSDCNVTSFNRREMVVDVDGFSNYSLQGRQDFEVDMDVEPELKDKVYQTIDLGDTNRADNYTCIVQIFGRSSDDGAWVLVQTNPEREAVGNFIGDPDPNQPESLGYFPVKDGMANVYFRDDNLAGYHDFQYVARCQNSQNVSIYEQSILTTYSPLGRKTQGRGAWLMQGSNAFYLVIYIIGGIIGLWFLGMVWQAIKI